MKEHAIPFSAPLDRALLRGQKTITDRETRHAAQECAPEGASEAAMSNRGSRQRSNQRITRRNNPSRGLQPRRNGDGGDAGSPAKPLSPEELFREQMKQMAFAKHAARIAGTESYDFEGYLYPAGGRFRNAVPVRSHAEARAYARGQIAQAVMHKRGITGGEYRITHVMPRRAPQVIEHVIVDGKTPTAVILNGQRVPGTEHIPSRFDAPRENPRRGHRLARRNPRARPAPKHPMVVLVRRFDPTGEELTTWEPLYVSGEGLTFFSPTKAKAAALKPPRDADLHVGDIIVTVPAEAVSGIEEYATGLYVVAPDGVKAAPMPPKVLGGPWLATWGQNAYVMLRASSDVERRRLVMAACDCAETVLHLVPAGEDRPRKAIETALAWCRGEASINDVRAYATDARAAYADAANADDYDAAASSSAAAYAAAAAAADDLAPATAWAAASDATWAAASAASTPRESTYRALAPLVERWIPLPVVLLSTLGYPDAIPFDPGMVPASFTGPRENPRHPSRRRSRR